MMPGCGLRGHSVLPVQSGALPGLLFSAPFPPKEPQVVTQSPAGGALQVRASRGGSVHTAGWVDSGASGKAACGQQAVLAAGELGQAEFETVAGTSVLPLGQEQNSLRR